MDRPHLTRQILDAAADHTTNRALKTLARLAALALTHHYALPPTL